MFSLYKHELFTHFTSSRVNIEGTNIFVWIGNYINHIAIHGFGNNLFMFAHAHKVKTLTRVTGSNPMNPPPMKLFCIEKYSFYVILNEIAEVYENFQHQSNFGWNNFEGWIPPKSPVLLKSRFRFSRQMRHLHNSLALWKQKKS